MFKNFFTILFCFILLLSNLIFANKSINYMQIENLARTHAKADANPKKLSWGVGSFGASLLLSPLLGGGVTTALAYGSEGDTDVPSSRAMYINDKYGYEGLMHYSAVYSTQIGKIQKKGNGGAALNGALACWALFMVIILNSDTGY